MYAREEATRLELTGWVRNLADGDVEVVAEGEDGAVEEFLKWCRHGPPYAHVTSVEVAHSPATSELDSFRITF